MMAFSFKTAGPFDYHLSLYFFLLLGLLFTAVFSVPHQHRDDRTKLNAATSYYDTFNHSSFDTLDEQQVIRRFDELEITSDAAAVHLNNQIADGNVTKLSELNAAAQHLTLNASTPTDNITVSMMLSADDSVCYKDLGCINRFSFADPILWPINLLPQPRNLIDTHFTLNTREQPTPPPGVRVSAKDTNGIVAASFNATLQTKIFIHGWLSTGYEDLYKTLVARLLAYGDFNVIVVHWGGGAFTSYNQAYVNIRLVGLEIAHLVNTLIKKLGVKASDVHLIGHSLGAHTAGYAGEKIPNLGRITGLDPAGWYIKGMPNYVRLDPSDAQFVDAVHTDGDNAYLSVGLLEPAGHLDFYPNGGANQPGCLLSELPPAINPIDYQINYSQIDINLACSHMRAVDLYSESLLADDGCQRKGFECSDYRSFEKAECTSCELDRQCAVFGLEAMPIANRVNVKFYFNTGDSSPYCRYHYAMNVSLANPGVAKPTVSGILKLSISGQTGAGSLSNVQLPASNFQHGSDHHFLLTVPTRLDPVVKVNLDWKFVPTHFLDVSCFLGLCNRRLYVNSVTISAINSYPLVAGNTSVNVYKNCPQFTPGIIGQHFDLQLSVDNNCSATRFSLLNYYIRPLISLAQRIA